MIPEQPTESNVKAVLQELPRVHTRVEAIAILSKRRDAVDSERSLGAGLILDLAVTFGIYPDDVKVL